MKLILVYLLVLTFFVLSTLMTAKDDSVFIDMIINLHCKFKLQPKTDVMAFLGIQLVQNEATHTITLTQPRLIQQILEACHMVDCHKKVTPTTCIPLGSDEKG